MKHIALLFFLVFIFTGACTPVAQVAPIPEIKDPTGTPPLLSTSTPTVMAFPTATSTPVSTPTLIATLHPMRKTPPTLMLHRPSLQFDSLAFLKEFIDILKQQNMKVGPIGIFPRTRKSQRPNKGDYLSSRSTIFPSPIP